MNILLYFTLPFKILFGIASTAKCVLLMRSRLSPLDKRFNYKYTAQCVCFFNKNISILYIETV
jgi:hypothetical protein